MTKVCKISVEKAFYPLKKGVKKAFSLIELLVVILILGLLVGLVAPEVIGQGTQAQIKIACTQMGAVKEALKIFKIHNGKYPDTEEGLEALLKNPDPDKYPNYSASPYLDKLPVDPWGKPYTYIKTGKEFNIISFGPDKTDGGTGEDADIIFPQCSEKNAQKNANQQ